MLSSLLDILLPKNCPLCFGVNVSTRPDKTSPEEEAGGLCRACAFDFKKITEPMCTLCGTPFVTGIGENHLCAECISKKRIPFIKVRSALYYTHNTPGAIRLFKYHGLFALRPAFAEFIRPILFEFKDTNLIVPVPLHKSRLRHRGFNQSLMLARIVSKQLKKDLDYTTLKRTRQTRAQTGLKGEERRRNVKGAFQVKDSSVFKGKRVLLVDDVYTTGATITECARTLKRAGAEISVLTLARTARV